MHLDKIISNYQDQYLPHLSVDTVIFGYKQERLYCLLLQYGDLWFLPGGFIRVDESVGAAAKRTVQERTSIDKMYLHFFNNFGESDRSFREDFKRIFKEKNLAIEDDHPMLQRFVTMGYLALLEMDAVQPTSAFDDAIAWHPIDDLPQMAGDHLNIIQDAKHYLANLNEFTPVGHNLMPKQFTMPQLHKLEQVISGRELDRSRFQKKMLSLDIYKRHEEITTSVRGRNPYLYTYEGPNNLERI